MSRFSNEEKLKVLRRELSYRRYVYPKRVAVGKMTQEASDYQIGVIEAMVADYEDLAAGDRLRAEAEAAKERLL